MTALKFSELADALRDAIAEASLLADAGIAVIVHDGLQEKAIERQMRTKGAVVVVSPVYRWERRDQSGPRWLNDVTLLVHVQMNPDRNADTDSGGAGVDMYELIVAVKNAATERERHPGSEFFKDQGGELSTFDSGLWSYILTFTKEAVA